MFSVFVLSSFGQCSFGSNSYRTSNNRDITLFFRAVFEFISHSNKLCILGLEYSCRFCVPRSRLRRILFEWQGILQLSPWSNCRIPCHFDCVTENCGYAVRGTRKEINSVSNYLRSWLRGTWYGNEINSKSQTILEAGYAVRGTWNEINSKSQTILEAGYAVRGTRKEINSKCEATLEAGYAVRGTRKEINSKCEATLEINYVYLDLNIHVVSAYRVAGYAEYCSSGRVFCS